MSNAIARPARGKYPLVMILALVTSLACASASDLHRDLDPYEIARIRDLLHRYSIFIDDARGEDFEELFSEGATFNVLDMRLEGRSAIRKEFIGAPGRLRKHLPFPAVIEIRSPGEALAWSDFIMVKIKEPGDPSAWEIYQMGRYHDRLIKEEDGRWRFAERSVHLPGMKNTFEFPPIPAR